MDEKNNRSSMEQRRMAKERKERIERRRRAKKKAMMRRMAILIGLIVLVLGCIVGVTVSIVSKNRARKAEEKAQKRLRLWRKEAEFAKKKDLVVTGGCYGSGV